MTIYDQMNGLEWLKENRANIEATGKFIEDQIKKSSLSDAVGCNPIIAYAAKLHLEITTLKYELNKSEVNSKYYKKQLDDQKGFFADQLGVKKSIFKNIQPDLTDEEKSLIEDINDTVSDAGQVMEQSLYEPSERGAGYAVTSSGCDQAAEIIHDCITKQQKPKKKENKNV